MDYKERIIIFIDESNFYLLKDIYGAFKTLMHFNFEKFAKFILEDRKLIRVCYYNARLDRKKDELTYAKPQKFFERLKLIPDFKLILCRMQKEKINEKVIYLVKEDDIHLAGDMVRLAYNNSYD